MLQKKLSGWNINIDCDISQIIYNNVIKVTLAE